MAHRNFPRNFLRPKALVAAGLIAMTLVYQLTGVTPVHSFFGVDQQSQQSPIQMSELAAAADPAVPYAPVSEQDRERFDEVKELLSSISTGREALRIMEEYQVRLEFRSGEGTGYAWHDNRVVIEAGKNSTGSVLSLVHEMTHASRAHQGMWADPRFLSRQAYIDGWLEEEAEGETRAVEAKMELEAMGLPVSEERLLEKQYLRAYQAAVTSAQTKEPELTGPALKRLGRQAGKEAVIEGFRGGLAVTSTNLETYGSWYGKFWDEVNLAVEAK